ncbi:MAG: cytidine deaminase [Candidatus Enteromonas sp.]|nr:cytidine deaminase [Candidatus Enteromonas sp.]MDY5298085.1 cytidine deaminase [Candidatus Enteromonas sp.]
MKLSPEELLNKAKQARALSYSPYSHFAVGAALECADGSVFCGANIENASFPLSMCAERNAIYHALMRGKKKEDFVSLTIVADTDEPCSPCGACRQVLWELFPLDAPIYLGNLKNEIKHVTAKELLPFAFNGEDL